MIHRLEILRGRRDSAPALVKHTIRFARRLRAHGIYHASFPPLIDDDHSACKVVIGMRQINVFDDGTFTRSLLRKDDHFDGRAFIAQSNRMHALYLAMAGCARANGLVACARDDLQLAIQERHHHERRD